MAILTRQQKETLVLELYNQGKTYREIAEEVRISPRDIGAILNKAAKSVENKESDNNKQSSLSTQAYELFSQGKKPVEVAIGLNLKESETARFYKEFWRLNQQHRLAMVYEDIKEDIVLFLKLYKLAKVEHMGPEDVVKLLVTASKTDGLRSFEQKCDWLDNEARSLEMKITTSKQVLQTLDREIKNSSKLLDSLRSFIRQETTKISNLYKEKIKLKGQIRLFRKNNKDYQKIRQVAEEKVSGLLSDKKLLLKLALFSLIESIRNDRNNYNHILGILTSSAITAEVDYHTTNQFLLDLTGQSQSNSGKRYKDMLIEEAEKLYNKLIKDLPDDIIGESLSSSIVLPPKFSQGNTTLAI